MSDSPAPETSTCTKVFDWVTKFMRPLNFTFGALTIACGVYNFILSFESDFGTVLRCCLSCIFTVILGLLLLVGEIPRLAIVKENCKFLILFLGRGLFDIFVGGWVYSLAFLHTTASALPNILYYINWIVINISPTS